MSAATEVLHTKVQQSLIQMSTARLGRPVTGNHRHNSFSKLQTPIPQIEALPCPIPVADFAGQYSHPAYGPISLTVAISESSPSEKVLEGLFYPRTWPLKIQLFHVSDTVFAVKSFSPHGLGNITSGKDIVWEDETDDDDRAVFELGLDGAVERMGIELEESMVEVARSKGKNHWKEGMIWFEKSTAS